MPSGHVFLVKRVGVTIVKYRLILLKAELIDKLKVKALHALSISFSEKLSVSVTAPSELDSKKGSFVCTAGGYPAPDVTITKTDLNGDNHVSQGL